MTVTGKNKWPDLTISGTKTNTKAIVTVTSLVRGADAPVLAEGMVPIKWDDDQSKWVDTTTSDVNWYNYDTTTKKWANARTKDCTPPDNPNNIGTCSMWVWIPRYVYKIQAGGWHQKTAVTIDIQFTKGVDDNWNKASVGTIDLREGAEASRVETNGDKYTNHPAFTFGDTELTGIWVAKFEASVPIDDECYTTPNSTNCNDTEILPNIVPNVQSWRSINIGNQFTVSRNMEKNNKYGWGASGNGIDTHLMKNVEWGAVLYLSRSNFGNPNEITINRSDYYTGGGTEDEYTTNGDQSTTGNIYGVYDMPGGAYEYTAAYVNNGNNNLSKYGESIVNADAKYKNVYTVGTTDTSANNHLLAINHKGDSIYETSSVPGEANSWLLDFAYMPFNNNPWFIRGSECSDQAGAFSFDNRNGQTNSSISWRPVLLVGSGL